MVERLRNLIKYRFIALAIQIRSRAVVQMLANPSCSACVILTLTGVVIVKTRYPRQVFVGIILFYRLLLHNLCYPPKW